VSASKSPANIESLHQKEEPNRRGAEVMWESDSGMAVLSTQGGAPLPSYQLPAQKSLAPGEYTGGPEPLARSSQQAAVTPPCHATAITSRSRLWPSSRTCVAIPASPGEPEIRR
jgi:hypothetical protein